MKYMQSPPIECKVPEDGAVPDTVLGSLGAMAILSIRLVYIKEPTAFSFLFASSLSKHSLNPYFVARLP